MIEAVSGLLAFPRAQIAGFPTEFQNPFSSTPELRRNKRARRQAERFVPRARHRVYGIAFTLTIFAATGLYGTVRGGQYAEFAKHYGSPADLVARMAGFPIAAVTISGIKELDQHEILAAAAIDPSDSLLFLDPANVRERLKALPLVRDAVVTKLFPNRLVIAIDERDPKAVWQRDGKLSIVSGEGVVIDTLNDDRFVGLPFVVGDGAATRVGEYIALREAAGDLRDRIVAGVLVANRRWSLKIDNCIEVHLPETGAIEAVARLAILQRDTKLLDKDLVSIDLRRPDRITAQLTADAAAARAEQIAKKPKQKGSPG